MDKKVVVALIAVICICMVLSSAASGATYYFTTQSSSVSSSPAATSNPASSANATSAPTATSATVQPTVSPTNLSPAVNPSTFTQYTGYDLNGADVSGQTSASPSTCLTNCAASPACSFYVTDAAGQSCWLKNNPTSFVYNPNRTAFTQAGSPNFTPVATLSNGQWLFNGGTNPTAMLMSPNGLYLATLQGDSNLCIHRTDTNKLCWCSSNGGSGTPLKLIVQPDNNLVVYANATNNNTIGTAAGKAIWSSGTSGKGTAGQAALTLQNDGNMVLYQGTTVLWASGSNGC